MRKQTVIIFIFALSIFLIIGCNCQISLGEKKARASAETRANKQFLIAAQPVQGEIHGTAFMCEASAVEDGVLKLREGKDFFADREVTVFLFTPKGEIPAGRVFQIIEREIYDHTTPHINISWKEGGVDLPKHKSYMQSYTMHLEFGKQHDKKLPGKIYLKISDDPETLLEGEFEAEVKGFIVKDGKPDLTSDSFETLKFVAEAYLKNVYPNQTVKDLKFSDGTYTHPFPSQKYQRGYIEARYSLADGRSIIKRLRFIKEPGGWRVFDTLQKDQLRSAHPIEPPDPKDPLAGHFEYLMAIKIEEEAHKLFPGKAIYTGMGFGNGCGYNPLVSLGECVGRYTVDGEKEPIEKKYLFRLTDKGWIIDRELAKNKKVNFKTGTIENVSK